jgi:hypothetical protein
MPPDRDRLRLADRYTDVAVRHRPSVGDLLPHPTATPHSRQASPSSPAMLPTSTVPPALRARTPASRTPGLGWRLSLVTAGGAHPTCWTETGGCPWPGSAFPIGLPHRDVSNHSSTLRTSPQAGRRSRRKQACARLPIPVPTGDRLPGSPISGGPAGLQGPRAGDRLPGAPVTGRPAADHLHQMLAPDRFHLLLSGPPDAWPAGDGVAGR